MATLNNLKPGQEVYLKSTRHKSYFPVKIISVNLQKRTVVASLNYNPASIYTERHAKAWRVSKPTGKR